MAVEGEILFHPSVGGNDLRDAGAAHADDGDAVFRGANGAEAGVGHVLGFAPVDHVHRRDDEGLRALADEFVNDARVAEVVADRDADPAPGRLPNLLRRGGFAVLEELDRLLLGLLEDDLAVRGNDEGRIVEAAIGQVVLAADDQIPAVVAAPLQHGLGRVGFEGVFAENDQLGLGITGDQLVQSGEHFVVRRKLQLGPGDLDGFGGGGRSKGEEQCG